MGTEGVYGVQVNQEGGMAKLARSLLHVHFVFLIVYTASGFVQMISALMASRTPVDGQPAHRTDFLQIARTSSSSELFLGFCFIGGSIALFLVLRFGIQTNSLELITSVMACDGCCAMCNCFIGCCGLMGVFALFAVKQSYDTMDVCACQTAQDSARACSHPCSTCFDMDKCQRDVQTFRDDFGGSVFIALVWTVLFCAEMLLCAFAADRLVRAKRNMPLTPFCLCGLPPPQIAGIQVAPPGLGGMPQPMGTTVVVGQPVQSQNPAVIGNPGNPKVVD